MERIRRPKDDLSVYQREQLERLIIGQKFKPWNFTMRITTAKALEKKGYLKILDGKPWGMSGYSTYKRIK